MTPPPGSSALPPRDAPGASPKAISGRTSYLRVRLEFLRYPPLLPALFNGRGCGPPPPSTAASAWARVGHPVSGPRGPTIRPLQTRSPCGSAPSALSLAGSRGSPDRSTKSTRSGMPGARPGDALPPSVGAGFQALFHSPPGVLFTFPSRYSFAIGHQPVSLPWGVVPPPSHRVPRVLWYSGSCPYGVLSAYGAFTLSGRSFQYRSASKLHSVGSPYPETFPKVCLGLGFSAFARRYSRSLV